MIEVQVFQQPDLYFCFRDPIVAIEEVFLSDPEMFKNLNFDCSSEVNHKENFSLVVQ